MQALRDLLYRQVKENCRTDLHKKRFIDRCASWFDLLWVYELTDEWMIDWWQALSDCIYQYMDDGEIETTIDSIMETGIEKNVLSHNKEANNAI